MKKKITTLLIVSTIGLSSGAVFADKDKTACKTYQTGSN